MPSLPRVVPNAAAGVAEELFLALRGRSEIGPVADRLADVDSAYAASLCFLDLRLSAGERTIGCKVGLTSAPARGALGADEPDFGWLTDAMVLSGRSVSIAKSFNKPRLEAELGFVLEKDLSDAPDRAEVAAAIGGVIPAFEVIDTRIADWRIGLLDTIADNASAAAFKIGCGTGRRGVTDTAAQLRLSRNGETVGEGSAAKAFDAGVDALLWLGRAVARQGGRLVAGDIVLSGAVFPPVMVRALDVFRFEVTGLGSCELSFDN